MSKKIILFGMFMLCCMQQLLAAPQPIKINEHKKMVFINKMVDKYHFDRTYISKLLDNAHFLPFIIQSMKKPYEAKPWYMYKKHFLTKKRIQHGITYWKANRKYLAEAEKKYGIPENIIVSIIGIESLYGKFQGKFRVLNVLYTLAFAYPPRERFFQKELEQYLLLTRELKINPESLYGSYAGAMGPPQFMPSTFRHYAVTLGKKGKLFSNTKSVIDSVANYLNKMGWKRNGLIVVRAKIIGDNYKKLLNKSLKPQFTVVISKQYGVNPIQSLPNNTKVKLLQLKKKNSYEYWLGLNNFYAITRYNSSVQYAMVVYQLAEAIKHEK